MKLPRNLNGLALAKSLEPSHQRIAIPAHKSLRVGTLNHILKSVAYHKQISRQEILDKL